MSNEADHCRTPLAHYSRNPKLRETGNRIISVVCNLINSSSKAQRVLLSEKHLKIHRKKNTSTPKSFVVSVCLPQDRENSGNAAAELGSLMVKMGTPSDKLLGTG